MQSEKKVGGVGMHITRTKHMVRGGHFPRYPVQGGFQAEADPQGASLLVTPFTFPFSDLYGAVCLLASKETAGP